jgi:predicted protein tyrosine phosphatase
MTGVGRLSRIGAPEQPETSMPSIIVCSLSQLSTTVAAHSASHLVTLIKDGTRVERPASIVAEQHLFLAFDDITEPMDGMIAPAEEHAQALLGFIAKWDWQRPIVVHCFAGISRSTAGAFISMCAVRPEQPEIDIARRLRAASPFATPNIRLVGFADQLLGRRGRMVAAIESIGRGETAYEGVPFVLPLGDGA